MTLPALYRVTCTWRNGSIEVVPGVFELSPDEANQLAVDCPDGVAPLPANEAAKLQALLDDLGVVNASFRPGPDTYDHRNSAAKDVMTSANTPGLVPR